MQERFLTTREKLTILLLNSKIPLSPKEIMRRLSIGNERELFDHIYHIARSGKRKGLVVFVIPPRCEDCGFEFNIEKRIRNPKRCPRCKSDKISSPKFLIRRRE